MYPSCAARTPLLPSFRCGFSFDFFRAYAKALALHKAKEHADKYELMHVSAHLCIVHMGACACT